METFFILSSIFIFSLFIIKGLESIRNKAYKSLNSTRVVKKSTSIVRLYRFDKMYRVSS